MRALAKMVSPDRPARVTLSDGREVTLTDTEVIKVSAKELKSAIEKAQRAGA